MSDSPVPPSPDKAPLQRGAPPRDDAQRLDELRRILLGQEAEQLGRLEHRVDRVAAMEEEGQVPAMSRVLPEAITLRGDDDRTLVNALGPTIERSIHVSIRRNPKPFVDALFPIIGPAIRRSIAEALRGMVETINRTLEHSLSVRSLRWRLEAARTGRPFSEVVISHTLAYRVDHVFLIERHSGLPIQHVSAEGAAELDSDIISGMMSAVQGFMRESFGASNEQSLNRVEMGDMTLLVEPGPKAVLAVVFRGVLTRELRERLQDLIEVIHLQHGAEFAGYNGNMEAFAHLSPLLQAGLHFEMKPSEARAGWWWIALVAAVFVGAAVWLAFDMRENARFRDYVQRLSDEPGIVVSDAGRSAGRWYVEGLRDPLAADPTALLGGSGPDEVDFRWEGYLALHPDLTVRRLATQWGMPASVTLAMRGDTLFASGQAPVEWVHAARRRAAVTPGVAAYDDRALEAISARTADEALGAIEDVRIFFDSGSADIREGQESVLDHLAAWMQSLEAVDDGDGSWRIGIYGLYSADGSAALNRLLGSRRAAAVRDALAARGVPADRLVLIDVDPAQAVRRSADPALNRSVYFRIERP